MTRRLEELELKRMQAVAEAPVQVKLCPIVNHLNIWPNNNAPYGNTYNSSWRNHPNFSWKARATQYQQPDPPSHNLQPTPKPHVEKEEEIKKGKEMEDKESEISEEKKDSDSTMKVIPEKASEGRNAEEINFSTFSSSITWEKGVRNAAEILEDLCTIKRGLTVNKKAFLTEQVSAILQCKSPLKYKDPGSPTISVMIGGKVVEKALLDLGASVNLLPYSVYKQLGLGELKPTAITLSLADRSVKIPRGVIEDVLVQVDNFYYPVDFIVLDTDPTVKEANLVPIILGRPFLATSNAIINCRNGLMQLTFGNMTLDLNIFYMSKKQITPEKKKVQKSYVLLILWWRSTAIKYARQVE
ncbi:hypothetical protein CK203_103588 [Vitis vinifera]|uniref:Aspartic peptidase DDI1-type domain-containing protein n=1 Tax=Vitis vinifera TaxID=29760 RepID=A0A438D1H5_VITVI|nr:hypothetical protein CK203_103588 [Vitis vinifera]